MLGSLRLSAVLAASLSWHSSAHPWRAPDGSGWTTRMRATRRSTFGRHLRRRTSSPSRSPAAASRGSSAIPGAPLIASEPCTTVDPNTASCPVPFGHGHADPWLTVALGDEDDWASLEDACKHSAASVDCDGLTIRGERGNDTLIGEADANSWTYGGAGDDDLSGGNIDGGPGADTLSGRTSAALYENRRRPSPSRSTASATTGKQGRTTSCRRPASSSGAHTTTS